MKELAYLRYQEERARLVGAVRFIQLTYTEDDRQRDRENYQAIRGTRIGTEVSSARNEQVVGSGGYRGFVATFRRILRI